MAIFFQIVELVFIGIAMFLENAQSVPELKRGN